MECFRNRLLGLAADLLSFEAEALPHRRDQLDGGLDQYLVVVNEAVVDLRPDEVEVRCVSSKKHHL